MMAWRIARRELRGGLSGFYVFLACLALGVAAIAAVGSVRVSIQQGLEREGATILGGDAEMSFTYRFADETEAKACDAWLKDAGIIVRHPKSYNLPHCLRITIGDEASCRRVAHAIAGFKDQSK